MNVVYLAFGSNKGNKINFINNAFDELTKNDKFRVVKKSSFYETKPFGEIKQEHYINAVAKFETELSLEEVFFFVKETEKKLGRKKSLRWGPREIDIDILFYNNVIYKNGSLEIPHKGIIHRDFVIIPLKEIDRKYIHPVLNICIEEIDIEKLEKCIISKV